MRALDENRDQLERTRRALAAKVRELRRSRGWTQATLAGHLGLSQSRLSELEGGDGSFSAEHLVALLALFHVDLGSLGLVGDDDGDLHNALVRAGARHLRERTDVVPSGHYSRPADVLSEVLLNARSDRWVTALAPVLLWSVDDLPLPAIQHELVASGVPNRLGWLVENVLVSAEVTAPPRGAWSTQWRRAEVVCRAFLGRIEPSNPTDLDALDRGIRSSKSWDQVWSSASPISRRWGIVTSLQPDDFARALGGAYASD
jgi:transcriptional regulator with XRE-family HTH domain